MNRLEGAAIYVIVIVASVVLWILGKGPFFPPFGSTTANSEGGQ